MNGNYNNDASQGGSIFNVLAGIWLIISPWALGFAGLPAATWNTGVLGIAILILGAIRLGTVGTQGLSWVNLLLGIWLIISPFVLQFTGSTNGMWNAVIVGILVGLFSLWAALAPVGTPSVR
jgi:hypothetical protein